jgi:hypothetical protein
MADLVKERTLERTARAVLADLLRMVPSAAIKNRRPSVVDADTGIDGCIQVRSLQGPRLIVYQCKSSGQPRHAREAALLLQHFARQHPNAYPVFVAPYVSPASASICREYGVGYADLSGNCQLSFGPVYIERTSYPNAARAPRELRSLYSPKSERVLRVLLLDPRRWWRVQELASEANVSLGHVANVKRRLSEREWVESGTKGFILREPGALLRDWRANFRLRGRRHELFSIEGRDRVERNLAKAAGQLGIGWALTQFSAAERFAPTVRGQRTSAYWLGDVEAVRRVAGLKAVASGSNVLLIVPHDEGVLYGVRKIKGVPVVSPAQAYLDLQAAGLRSEEAAEELLEQVLRRQW